MKTRMSQTSVLPSYTGIDQQSQAMPSFTQLDYDGSWRQVAVLGLKHLVLIFLTLGIYRFWASARFRRYFWSHTALDGERFEYSGTGTELFHGLLWALIFLIPLTLVYSLLSLILAFSGWDDWGILSVGLYFIVFTFLIQAALFGRYRFMASRTRWRGIRFEIENKRWSYASYASIQLLLSLVSLGIYYPWAIIKIYAWIVDRSAFGTQTLKMTRISRGLLVRGFGLVFGVFGYFIFLYLATIAILIAVSASDQRPDLDFSLKLIGQAFTLFMVLTFVFYPVWLLFRSLWVARLINNLAAGLSFRKSRIQSNLSYRTLFAVGMEIYALTLIAGLTSIALGIGVTFSFDALVEFFSALMEGAMRQENPDISKENVVSFNRYYLGCIIGYLIFNQFYSALIGPLGMHRFMVRLPKLIHLEEKLDIEGVMQAKQRVGQSGEGMAAALDVGV